MSGGRGGLGDSRTRRGPQSRANPQQHFGSFGATPGGGQPSGGLPKATPADSPRFGPSYERSSGTMRPATIGNIATALAGALPGGGLIQGAIAKAKGTPTDPYSGPSKPATNFSHNGPDRTAATARRRRAVRTGLGEGASGRTATLG